MSNPKQLIDVPTRKLNRLTVRMPKSGMHWCGNCDANHIADGHKCEVCGYINRKPMHYKDIP